MYIVDKEIAQLLKEKGFDEPCIHLYKGDADEWPAYEFKGIMTVRNSKMEYIAAPTLEQVNDWVNARGYYVDSFIDDDSENPWTYNVYELSESGVKCIHHHHNEYFSTRGGQYEALEAGLKWVLRYAL